MRALIVVVIASCAIPLAFISPLLGLMAYCWLSYMRPTELAWGVSHISFGLYTALALFAGLFVRMRWNFFRGTPITYCMLALWAWWGLASWFAIDRVVGLEAFEQISRIFLICLVTTGLCTDRRKLNLVIWAIVGSLAFHGVKHGLFGMANPGASMNQGIGGMMSGNNENAIAFNFAFPFLVYLGFEPAAKWRRWGLWTAAFLTGLAVVFSHSRGGFLGLAAAGAVIVWRTRARLLAFALGLPASIALFFTFAPESMIRRIAGISDATTSDMSVVYRFKAWEVACDIAARHPILGIGPKNFVDQFRRFPHPVDMPRMEVHNTYLELASGNGLPGLLLYLLLAWLVFRTCTKVLQEVRRRDDPSLSWYANVARASQAAIAAFMVSSTFGSLAHFDLLYHLAALVACVPVALRAELRARDAEARSEPTSSAQEGVVAAALEATRPTRRRWTPCWHVATVSSLSVPAETHEPSVEEGPLPQVLRVRDAQAESAALPTVDRRPARDTDLPASRVEDVETRFWDVDRERSADDTADADLDAYDEYLADFTCTYVGSGSARRTSELSDEDDLAVRLDSSSAVASRPSLLQAVGARLSNLVVVAPRD